MDSPTEGYWQEALILAEQSHKMFQHSATTIDEIERKSTEALELLSQRHLFLSCDMILFMMMLS